MPNPGPPEVGDYERIIYALVEKAGDSLQTNVIGPEASHFVYRRALGSVHLVVLRWTTEESTLPRATEAMKIARAASLDLIVVGGPTSARDAVKKGVGVFTMNRLGLVHLGADRTYWQQRSTVAHDLLKGVVNDLDAVVVTPDRLQAILDRTARSRAEFAAQAVQLDAFQQRLQRRRPVGTWSLLAVIAAVFGLELLLGGTSVPPVLVRLGALVPARVYEGEWWRLVSCAFLHGGLQHVLLNSFVLYILGSFIERIIGTYRFLILYALAAVGGGIGSLLFLEASMSIGASGAIWGLLGAQAILAYRPRGLLPDAMLPGARSAARTNLFLNVLVSFLPFVDMYAHFAGGLVGALVWLSGLVTYGVPALERAGRGPEGADRTDEIFTPVGLKIGGVVGAGALMAGLVGGWSVSAPFAMLGEATLGHRAFEAVALTADVPVGLEPLVRTEEVQGQTVLIVQLGEVRGDPIMVELRRRNFPELRPDQRDSELQGLIDALRAPGRGRILRAPVRFESGEDVGVEVTYQYPDGPIHERAFMLRGTVLFNADVVRWPEIRMGRAAGLARRIAESAQPL